MLKSEIANHRMVTELYKVNESHGVKTFRLKSLSAEGLAKIELLITKKKRKLTSYTLQKNIRN